jgi:hypothetical protein
MEIHMSSRVKSLLESGVITIGAHITRDGIDCWARSVRPHPRAGVQTHTSYTLDEIEMLLKEVALPKSPQEISPRAEPPYTGSQSLELLNIGFRTLGEAESFHDAAKLNVTTRNGVRNQLPADSLTPSDFNRGAKVLFARAYAVAKKITNPKLVSHIASQRDKMMVNGSSDLFEWWSKATPVQKIKLLSKARHFPRSGEETLLARSWLTQIESLPPPFRSAEAQMGKSEEGPSAEENVFSSDDDALSAHGAEGEMEIVTW